MHAVEVAQKALDNAKARLEAGVVNRVEVTRAELQLVRARAGAARVAGHAGADLSRARHDHEHARAGRACCRPTRRRADEPPVETLTAQALQLRPEFTALREDDRLQPADRVVERVALGADAVGVRQPARLQLRRLLRRQVLVGGRPAARLDALRRRHPRRQRQLAQAQRRENEAKLDLLTRPGARRRVNANRALTTKRRALDAATRSVRLSKETLDLVQAQHDAGTATQLDLLQAQDTLVAAEVALAQARFDLALGGLSARAAVGQLSREPEPEVT